jgi:hypothetical protein
MVEVSLSHGGIMGAIKILNEMKTFSILQLRAPQGGHPSSATIHA